MIGLTVAIGALVVGGLYFAARIDADRIIVRIAVAGLIARALGMAARVRIIDSLYDGSSDSGFYHYMASLLVRGNELGVDPRLLGYNPRTSDAETIIRIVAYFYDLTTPSRFGGFALFTALSWFGAAFFYKAFANGVPGGANRVFAALVFLFPSLCYWPSSLGKDAWMVFTLGAAAWGTSLLLRNLLSPIGIVLAAGGLFGAALVRPHLAGLMAAAFVGAQFWIQRRQSVVRTALVAAVGVFVLTLLLAQLNTLFASEQAANQVDTIDNLLERTEQQTGRGGSTFRPAAVDSPLDMPLAIVTVLFRPLPIIDARSGPQLAGAIEAFGLLVVTVRQRRSLRSLPSSGREYVFVRFAAVYTLGYIVAFSYNANFGILARQRCQVLPIYFVLLSLTAAKRRAGTRRPGRGVATRNDSSPRLVHLDRRKDCLRFAPHTGTATRP